MVEPRVCTRSVPESTFPWPIGDRLGLSRHRTIRQVGNTLGEPLKHGLRLRRCVSGSPHRQVVELWILVPASRRRGETGPRSRSSERRNWHLPHRSRPCSRRRDCHAGVHGSRQPSVREGPELGSGIQGGRTTFALAAVTSRGLGTWTLGLRLRWRECSDDGSRAIINTTAVCRQFSLADEDRNLAVCP